MFCQCLLLCLVMLATRSVLAEFRLRLLEVRPRVYSNVVVLRANKTDLYVKHDKGMTIVKLKQLSPELQRRFDYDPAKATESVAQAIHPENFVRARGPATLGEDSLADSLSESLVPNKPMPELSVEKWNGEKPIMQGKRAMILFWSATSAASCRVITQLDTWQKKFSQELVVAGICPENEKGLTQMLEPKVEFASATDSKGKVANTAGVTTIPQILLLDRKNIVRYQGQPAAVNGKILEKLFAKFPMK